MARSHRDDRDRDRRPRRTTTSTRQLDAYLASREIIRRILETSREAFRIDGEGPTRRVASEAAAPRRSEQNAMGTQRHP